MKRLALIVALLVGFCINGHAAITLTVTATGGSSNDQSVTSSSVTTTGANFCVAGVSRNPGVAAGTMGDSKTNTWNTAPPTERGSGASGTAITVFYTSVPAAVGTLHTFTYTSAVSNFPSISVLCFGGVNTSPYDGVENGAQTAAMASTSLATGGITPSQDNDVLVVFANVDNTNTLSVANINVSYSFGTGTAGDGLHHYGNWGFYQIQTTATARSPTVTWTTSSGASAEQTAFKVAAAVTGPPTWKAMIGVGPK